MADVVEKAIFTSGYFVKNRTPLHLVRENRTSDSETLKSGDQPTKQEDTSKFSNQTKQQSKGKKTTYQQHQHQSPPTRANFSWCHAKRVCRTGVYSPAFSLASVSQHRLVESVTLQPSNSSTLKKPPYLDYRGKKQQGIILINVQCTYV